MDPGFMEKEPLVEKFLIVMLLLLLIVTYLLVPVYVYVIGKDVSQSGSMTVVPSSKGDLLICPRQQPGRLGVKEYVV
jgi:hypothetical protein